MRARRVYAGLVVALLLSMVLVGCMLPGAMAAADRLPSWEQHECSAQWRAVAAEDLPGSFESAEICGDIAACVLRIRYRFEATGDYQGEALLLFESGPVTSRIFGTWKLISGRLHLDDSESAEVVTDGRRLRLATSLGVVILERMP